MCHAAHQRKRLGVAYVPCSIESTPSFTVVSIANFPCAWAATLSLARAPSQWPRQSHRRHELQLRIVTDGAHTPLGMILIRSSPACDARAPRAAHPPRYPRSKRANQAPKWLTAAVARSAWPPVGLRGSPEITSRPGSFLRDRLFSARSTPCSIRHCG